MSARGSISRDGSGRWGFVVDLPSPDGRRRQARRRGFATKREAAAELDRLVGTVAVGLYVDPKRLTLGEYLERQWLPAKRVNVRPTTVDSYERAVRVHVVPSLGAVPLQQLERAQVASWVASLTGKGLSPKTVRNVHAVLAKALADAVELELVSRNVAAPPRNLPAARRPAPKAWTVEQLARFFGAVAGDRLYPLWRVIAATGCRRGEALGLSWSAIDLEAGKVSIGWQRTIAGGRVVEGEPKTTAGSRTVAIDPATVSALRSWRRIQSQDRLALGPGWSAGDLIFTNPDGTPLWPQRVTRRLKEISTELGLPLVGVHGLRHSNATHLIAGGTNPRVVQQRLGHAHVSVTLGLYTQVLPGHDEEAAAAIGALLDRSVTNL